MVLTVDEPMINIVNEKKSTFFKDVYLTYYPSGACNLNCIFCLMTEKASCKISCKKSDDLLNAFGSITSLFIMGAEPSIEPNLVNHILKYSVERKIPVKFVTNGFAPIENYQTMLDGLRPKDIEKITVSIDSIFPEIHNKIRGNNNSLNNALHCLKYLKDSGFNTRVQMTICDINYDSTIYTVQKLFEDYGIDSFSFHCMSISGQAKKNGLKHLSAFKWRELVQKLFILRDQLHINKFTIPLIAMTEDELLKYYFGDSIGVNNYIKSLDGKNEYYPCLCPALNQNFYYLVGYGEVARNSCCQIISYAKNSFHSFYCTKTKQFKLNYGLNSDIDIIKKSKFLCPATFEETGNKYGYEINKNGEKLFYICRHVNVSDECK